MSDDMTVLGFDPRPLGSCGGVTWTICNRDRTRWEVDCSCGFKVFDISSHEAAEDTKNWHRGDSTTLLGESPWAPSNGEITQ